MPFHGIRRNIRRAPMMAPLVYSGRVCARFALGLLLAVSASLCLVVATPQAAADPLARPSNPQAVEHLLKGNRLYVVREFHKAIEQYKAGVLIEDAPVFQYNLAQAYRALGQHGDALWHYERFVNQSNPSGELRRTVDEFIAQMREAIEDKRSRNQSAIAVQPRASGPSVAVHDVSARRERWYHDKLGWGISITGAILVAVGGYFLVDARRIDGLALEEDRDFEREELRDSASSRRLASYVLGGIGISTIGIGSIRLAIHNEGSSSSIVALSGSF